jgi:hypothetical protein
LLATLEQGRAQRLLQERTECLLVSAPKLHWFWSLAHILLHVYLLGTAGKG